MAYRIRMVPEVEGWLRQLRDSDPGIAGIVEEALAALRNQGASLGPPLVIPVEVRPEQARPDLDQAYQRQLEMLARVRRAVAEMVAARKRLRRRPLPGPLRPRRPSKARSPTPRTRTMTRCPAPASPLRRPAGRSASCGRERRSASCSPWSPRAQGRTRPSCLPPEPNVTGWTPGIPRRYANPGPATGGTRAVPANVEECLTISG